MKLKKAYAKILLTKLWQTDSFSQNKHITVWSVKPLLGPYTIYKISLALYDWSLLKSWYFEYFLRTYLPMRREFPDTSLRPCGTPDDNVVEARLRAGCAGHVARIKKDGPCATTRVMIEKTSDCVTPCPSLRGNPGQEAQKVLS